MKQVVIVRHGKAVPYGYEDDFTRDLRERGKNDAKIVCQELKKRGILPDAMISSPAKRAIKTAIIFAEHLDFDQKRIIEIEDIYDGLTTNEFLELIKKLPPSASTVFFFGHNPGFYYYVCNLLDEFYNDMPTTSTVGINFDVNTWEQIETRSGKLAFHLMPRMFK
ncbi:MAG TPA: histidine phosphatase family protein [Draconibacterium sp.]|nr:histidine phosphatase family protein [Draconibacterium sp.]